MLCKVEGNPACKHTSWDPSDLLCFIQLFLNARLLPCERPLALQERQEPANRAREEFNAAEAPCPCALQALHDDTVGLFYILYNLNIL